MMDQSEVAVTIHLNQDDQILLQRVFGVQDPTQIATSIAQLALEEWLDWIRGARRYTSDTDQSIDRVINIYAQFMPEAEPDISFLYNRFNIPYGRARYIIQAIVNRQLHSLNAKAMERLVQTLEAEWSELQKMDPDDRKVLQEVRFFVDPRSEKLLITIIDQMPIDIRPVSSFKRQPTFLPNTHEYSLSPRDLDNVLKAVKNFSL